MRALPRFLPLPLPPPEPRRRTCSPAQSTQALLGAVLVAALYGAGCDLFRQQPATQASPAHSAGGAESVAVRAEEPEPYALAAESASEALPPAPPPPAEAAIRQDAGPTRGRLSKRAIAEGVEPGLPAFQACYQRVLPEQPNLRGSLTVTFVIAPDGSVPYAAALESGTDLPDAGVIDCVLDEFQKLRFAEPVGGRSVATYPLRFDATPAAP